MRLWRRLLRALAALLLSAALVAGGVWWYLHPSITRTDAIPYGQRRGHTLALDIMRPSRPNGAAVLLLVSGGWRSQAPGTFGVLLASPLLRRGYTVIPVYHVSQPAATVMEIVDDMHRAVRFVRHHAKDFGIDAQRLGVAGGSAGGHLSLMLATRGGPGPADATDPVDRESSAVQAVAVFFPATDLLNLGTTTQNPGDGGPPKSFVKSFGPDATDMAKWQVIGRDISPIYHITSAMPPVLIHHGDADTLTTLEQSVRFRDAAGKVGRRVDLVVRKGGEHGWLTMPWDIRQFGMWFDKHLR
jgi:acetyl esterase/lipase